MKTKTNSFTKVINFCVLALFLITNMIFFTSCDNGNSPNDNTNEEQNNTQNTDFCEICDGLQTENCGIKHKCDDENCVEYSDNRIYKNGHTHDYCERTDCDGSTHMGADHPTGPTYPEWFKETPIGGENINVKHVDIDAVPGTNAKERFENIFAQYKTHIQSFNLDDKLYTDELPRVNFDLANATEFDQLIGTTDTNKENMCPYNGINDVCKNAIKIITRNIGVSGNKALDKDKFNIYYWAIGNEIYKLACGDGFDECGKTNYEEQKGNADSYSIIGCWAGIHNDAGITPEFDIYITENGTTSLNPRIFTELNTMVTAAATRLNVDPDKIYDALNLSWTANAIHGTHDRTISWTYTNENGQLKNAHHNSFDAGTANCTTNEMVNAIGEVKTAEMVAKIAPTKLNKSIFSHDYGRELV